LLTNWIATALRPGIMRLLLSLFFVAQASTAFAQLDRPAPDVLVLTPPAEGPVDVGPPVSPPRLDRTRGLRALEGTFIGLQALDIASTIRAANRGLGEANPLMRGVSGHLPLMVGVKSGSTAATVWLVSRVAKRNRVAGMVTMAAIDASYAAIVARNLSLAFRR
jgi:hypothetical protein